MHQLLKLRQSFQLLTTCSENQPRTHAAEHADPPGICDYSETASRQIRKIGLRGSLAKTGDSSDRSRGPLGYMPKTQSPPTTPPKASSSLTSLLRPSPLQLQRSEHRPKCHCRSRSRKNPSITSWLWTSDVVTTSICGFFSSALVT